MTIGDRLGCGRTGSTIEGGHFTEVLSRIHSGKDMKSSWTGLGVNLDASFKNDVEAVSVVSL